ncbi:hypothetical protein SAMN05216548_10852 [Faunimonas pinastri]|uniref:Secreted protein n=1 Tax=Faunimonas pinastri TaxID=1855383 RepID=A0A1H9JAM0_9HYPH|nr:hypothetical protein SAMN05216548_10852 [Faunimonas pinastri]
MHLRQTVAVIGAALTLGCSSAAFADAGIRTAPASNHAQEASAASLLQLAQWDRDPDDRRGWGPPPPPPPPRGDWDRERDWRDGPPPPGRTCSVDGEYFRMRHMQPMGSRCFIPGYGPGHTVR